jgi:hypothetical protein
MADQGLRDAALRIDARALRHTAERVARGHVVGRVSELVGGCVWTRVGCVWTRVVGRVQEQVDD